MAPHVEALYALAYLHSRDDETARQAVAGALGGVRRDLDSGCSDVGPDGSQGLWRALADRLHASRIPDPSVSGGPGDAARRHLGALRCEAIALHAGGCTDSHAAGLLGVSRPAVRQLRLGR
jgi:hypothetical protein